MICTVIRRFWPGFTGDGVTLPNVTTGSVSSCACVTAGASQERVSVTCVPVLKARAIMLTQRTTASLLE